MVTHLQNVQAYNLSIPHSSNDTFEWQHPNFSISIMFGETRDRHWLCLALTVPDELGFHQRNRTESTTKAAICEPPSDTTQTVSQLRLILDKLTPIPIYGYYAKGSGYEYIYNHEIVCAASPTKPHAISKRCVRQECCLLVNL